MADAIDALLDAPAPQQQGYSQLDQSKGIPNPQPQATGPGTANPTDAPVQDPSAPLEAAAGGVAQAGFEMKDTAMSLLGGDSTGKSQARKDIEGRTRTLDQQSPVNAISTSIAQFATAFIGLGKVLKPLAYGTGLLKPGAVADTLLGGVAGGVGFDPHEHALDSFIKEYPALQGPITQYLASKPGESDAAGRLRNGIENIVVGGAIAGAASVAAKASAKVLTSIVEAVKLRQAGDTAGANAAVEQAEGALKRTQRATDNAENPDSGTGRIGNDGTSAEPLPADTAFPEGGALGGEAADAAGGARPQGAGEPSVPRQDAEGRLGGNAEGGPGGGTGGGPAGATLERIPQNEQVKAQTPQAAPELTPEDVHGLIQKAQKDTGAILDAGSYDAAAQAGHSFADTDLIPWQKFSTGEERVDAWMARVVDEQADYINKVRGGDAAGVMSDKRVDMLVGRLGGLGMADPALLRGMILQAGKDAPVLVAKAEVAGVLAQKAFLDSYGMVTRISAGNTQGLPLEAAVQMAKERVADALEMFSAGKAMVAAGGRIVRRQQAQFSSVQMAQMEGMRGALDKMGTQDFLDIMSSTGGNPQALAAKVVPNALSQVISFGTMYAAAVKVWGWGPLAAIAFSNVSQLYFRPLAAFLGAHYELGSAVMKGDTAMVASATAMRAQARKEMLVTTSFLNEGWQGAKFAFLKGQSRLAPDAVNELASGGVSNNARLGMGPIGQGGDYRPISSIDDIVHNIHEAAQVLANDPADAAATTVALPFRVHGAMQEAVQTMRYRAVVMAKADAEALQMGLKPGSEDYLTHVQGRVRDSFDANGSAVDLDALQEAKETTFGNKLLTGPTDQTWTGKSSFGAAAQHFAQEYTALRFITPFVQFPINAFRRGIQLTPGLNLVQKQYYNDLTGVNGAMPQARATGEMGLGLLFGMKAVQMRIDGTMTGGSPDNYREAASRRDEKIMPYSVVYKGKDGKDNYFQLNRLEPYQAPFTFWADFADLLMAGHMGQWKMPETPESQLVDPVMKAFTGALITTMHLMKDKTSLTNISSILDSLQDENKLESMLSRTIPGMVAPAVFRDTNPDPFRHEIRGGAVAGMYDGLKAQFPVLSETLPIKRDFLGKPVKVPGKFFNDGVLPPDVKSALEENYVATGHFPTEPSPKTPEGLDLRDVTMQSGDNAYERYKHLLDEPKSGNSNLTNELTRLVSSDGYKTLTHGKTSEDGTREHAVESLLTAYHQSALGTLKMEKTDSGKPLAQLLASRKVDIMHQNLANQKDLRAVKAQATTNAVNRLLDSSGIGFRLPGPGSVPATTPGGQ